MLFSPFSLTEELQNQGVQEVFVFCTRGELNKYRVPSLLDVYQQRNFTVHHMPFPDGDAPELEQCCQILEELQVSLENNRRTVIQWVNWCLTLRVGVQTKCRRREPSDHVELFYISQFIFLVALDNKGTEMTSNIETLTRLNYSRWQFKLLSVEVFMLRQVKWYKNNTADTWCSSESLYSGCADWM